MRWGADAKAYVVAPLHLGRKQWLELGGATAAVMLAYQYDARVRAHFIPEDTRPIHKPHNPEDALPAAVALGAMWIPARLLNEPDRRREAGEMLEAAVFATTATELMTKISGRKQPNNGTRHAFHQRGDAFPSGHTAFAFGVGAVFAESGGEGPRWLRKTLGYGIGAVTAYERMKHDEHWLSDTVAGAGMGIATARFLTNRHGRAVELADSPRGFDGGQFTLAPMRGGIMVAYSWPLRR